MSWQQLIILTDKNQAEFIADWLEEQGTLSVTLRDAFDNPVLEPDPGTTPLWNSVEVVGLFSNDYAIDTLLILFTEHFGDTLQYKLEKLEDSNWQDKWREYAKPLKFGDNFWICPSHCDCPDPNGIYVRLDPGVAFGTGTHPSTAMCLQWLATHDLQNKTIIDYGCGSGILAIAALKLGAKKVLAVDHDTQALEATLSNAKQNNVDQNLILSLPEDFQALKADMLIANILANPLIELAPTLSKYVNPHGDLILAGILQEQAQAVIAAYKHFTLQVTNQTEEWVLLSTKH